MKYNSLDEIVKEYSIIYTKLGRRPTRKELVGLHMSGLEAAAGRYGGMYVVYEILGIEPPTKKDGYWSEQKTKEELESFIKEYGDFPTKKILNQNNKGGLCAAIDKFGGLNKFRKILGYELSQVPDGYYANFENVKSIIETCEKEIGKFPTIAELDKFRPGIKFGINKYHGGYKNIRVKLNEKIIRVENGYWDDFTNIKEEVDKIIMDIGVFPSCKHLKEYRNEGLYAAINSKFGGIDEVRKRMGFKPDSRYKNERRVKNIVDRYFEEETYVDNRKSDLHKKFGIELRDPYTKNYQELDRYYPNIKVAIEVQGEQHSKEVEYFAKKRALTKAEYLKKIEMRDLAKKIQCESQGVQIIYINYDDSKDTIIKKIKPYLTLRKTPLKYELNDEENARIILNKIYKEYGSINSELIKRTSMKLYNELLEEFGSTAEVRKHFGYEEGRVAKNTWTEELVLESLFELNQKLDRFPTKQEIQEFNHKLYYAVVKHGGIRKLRKKI